MDCGFLGNSIMVNSLLDGVISAEEARKIIGAKKNSLTREDFESFRDNNRAFVNFLNEKVTNVAEYGCREFTFLLGDVCNDYKINKTELLLPFIEYLGFEVKYERTMSGNPCVKVSW